MYMCRHINCMQTFDKKNNEYYRHMRGERTYDDTHKTRYCQDACAECRKNYQLRTSCRHFRRRKPRLFCLPGIVKAVLFVIFLSNLSQMQVEPQSPQLPRHAPTAALPTFPLLPLQNADPHSFPTVEHDDDDEHLNAQTAVEELDQARPILRR